MKKYYHLLSWIAAALCLVVAVIALVATKPLMLAGAGCLLLSAICFSWADR